jgi:Zn-dependent protease
MKQNLRLGWVAGIPVGASWTVTVTLMIVADILGADVLPSSVPHHSQGAYWATAIAGALLFELALFGHELAHALVAKHHGMRVRSITLWMLGGTTELDGDPPDAGADLRIALAGPATSLAEAVVFAVAAVAIGRRGGPELAVAASAWLAVMSGVLAVFNLLPGAPLDGGRVLRGVLWRAYRDRTRAAVASAKAGWYIGLVLIVAGAAELVLGRSLGGLWLILIGWFLGGAARAEGAITAATTALAGLQVADIMTPHPDIVASWTTVQQFAEGTGKYSRQNVFPVLGMGGELMGALFRKRLARVRPPDRPTTCIGAVTQRVPPTYLATPTDPAAGLLTSPLLGGELAAVVIEEGRVVGIVTGADITHAMLRAELRTGQGVWPRPRADASYLASR